MGARLQETFFDLDGTEYRVTLDVAGYGGSVDTFDLRNLKLTYNGDANNIHHPVLASSATITFSIPNSTIQSIFTSLSGAAEEDYRITIEKGASNDLFWCGFVIPDQVSVQDQPYPRDFTINAVDGIGRLKEKDYTGSGAVWEDEDTLLQHLYNILSFIALDDFWGGADTYLRTHNQLFATNHTAGVAVSPLDITRFNHRALVKVDKKGKVTRKKAYDVLVEICQATASRFYFSNGSYYLEQVTRYAAQDTDITIKNWDKTAGALSDEVLNNWAGRVLDVDRSSVRLAGSADLTIASGTINTFLSALSKFIVRYKHFATRSILSHISPPPTWTQAAQVEINTGPVDDNSGASRLLVTADITFTISYAVPANVEPGRLKMRCTLKLEGSSTYYCRRLATISTGQVSYQDPEWTTDVAYVEFYTDTHNGTGGSFLYQLALFAPNLPDSGDLSINFDFVELAGMTGIIAIGAGYTSNWTVSNVYGEVYSDGSVDAPTNETEFSSTNDDDTNSDQDSVTLILGDGPTGTAFGRIQIYDGAAWEDANEWRAYPDATYLPHGARIAQEMITPRLTPSERIEGTIVDTFMAHNIIERSSTRYMFINGSIDLYQNTVDGVWAFITDVSTLATTPDTGVDILIIEDGNFPVPPGPYVPPSPPIGWEGGTIEAGVVRMGLDDGMVFNTSGLIASGDTVTFLSVDERNVIHPFVDTDELEVINQYTGLSQTFTVDAIAESDKTISVSSVAASTDFPVGSMVAPGPAWMLQMMNKVRRHNVHLQLLPYYLDVPTETGVMPIIFDSFFVVPAWMDGYKVSMWTTSNYTIGTGAGYLNIDLNIAAASDTLKHNFNTISATNTYSTYITLATGDLIDVHITGASDTGTRPKGLTIDIQVIATI